MDKTRIAVELFDEFAQAYQDKYMDVDRYSESLDLFCRSLPTTGAEILELACGPGNITRYLLEKRPDLNVLATDLSTRMLELAKINNPTAECQLLDARELSSLGKKYDGIICGFGLPYLSREEALQLIRDAAVVLHPNGLLFLSTMEGDYSQSGFQGSSSGGEKKMFIHYHQSDYLTENLLNNGFEILDLSRKVSTAEAEAQTTDLLILARSKPEI